MTSILPMQRPASSSGFSCFLECDKNKRLKTVRHQQNWCISVSLICRTKMVIFLIKMHVWINATFGKCSFPPSINHFPSVLICFFPHTLSKLLIFSVGNNKVLWRDCLVLLQRICISTRMHFREQDMLIHSEQFFFLDSPTSFHAH